jgi:cytidylate kinase
MTPNQLINAGRLLYGRQWKTGMARELGVDRQTILGWAKGSWEKVSRLDRLLRDFAPAVQVYAGGGAMIPTAYEDQGYRDATERVIREYAARGEGVLLGRAASVVLLDDPRVLRVRIDGPAEARMAQAMAGEGIDRKTVKRRMKETDGARDAYMQHFYRRDSHDPSLYHLMLDTTAFSIDAAVEIIAMAARAHAAAIAGETD